MDSLRDDPTPDSVSGVVPHDYSQHSVQLWTSFQCYTSSNSIGALWLTALTGACAACAPITQGTLASVLKDIHLFSSATFSFPVVSLFVSCGGDVCVTSGVPPVSLSAGVFSCGAAAAGAGEGGAP